MKPAPSHIGPGKYESPFPPNPCNVVGPRECAGETPIENLGFVGPEPEGREQGVIRPLRFSSVIREPSQGGVQALAREWPLVTTLSGGGGSGGSGGSGGDPDPSFSGGTDELLLWTGTSDRFSFSVYDNDLAAVQLTQVDTTVIAGASLTITSQDSSGAVGYVTVTGIPGTPGVGNVTLTAYSQEAGPEGDGMDTYTVSISTYDIIGWEVEERVLGNASWHAPADGHVLWAMDDHRWLIISDPDDMLEQDDDVDEITWYHMAWDTYQGASGDYRADLSNWTEGTPGLGDYAVFPRVVFEPPTLADPDGTYWAGTVDRYFTTVVTQVQWVGYEGYVDQETNLVAPDLTHSDYRFFAEQNHPDAYRDASGTLQAVDDHELHNLVDVQVQITDAIPLGMMGTLHLRVYDPDNDILDGPTYTVDDGDPGSFENDGLYQVNDNYGGSPGMNPARVEITFSEGEDSAGQTFAIPNGKRQPGNNYIVAASSNMPAPKEYYHFAESDGETLYYWGHEIGSGGSGGSGGQATQIDVPPNLHTSMLTLWRTLWTELDSMLHPSTQSEPNKRGTFGSTQPEPDDAEFDPHSPDTSFLAAQMARACVRVESLPPTYDTRDDLPFWHNRPMVGSTAFTSQVRDVLSEADFWSAHIVGMYEADADWDYDGEDQWHIGQSNGPVFIYEEVIRDLSQNHPGARPEAEIERHIVLHEILHRFFGPHQSLPLELDNLTNTGNMDAPTTVTGDDTANALTRQQLRFIQEKDPQL